MDGGSQSSTTMNAPAWHTSALHDLENSGLSIAEIATKYKRSDQTIRKLLLRSKIVRKNKPTTPGPKRRENALPISRQHHAIGIRLSMARGPLTSRAFAEKLGVSLLVLAKMEVGQFDFHLSHLLQICQVTGKSLDQLTQTFDGNLYSNDGRLNARN